VRSIESILLEGKIQPRRMRRSPRVFDIEGREVFITMICSHCRLAKPLRAFGLRRMTDGSIRNCPWCKACRASAVPKKREEGGDG
jgi:hypothetical protein